MVSKNLFKSAKTPVEVKVNPNKWVQTTNEAGGAAFSFPDKLALAQFAVTGTFNNVFYATGESQLETIKKLVEKVDSVFLAKLAVYGHSSAFMKDVPSYLLAVLHSRGEIALLETVFPRVVTSFKMLANFVQIVRSGVTGRKSFGTATKRIIRNWLANKSATDVFNGSIGLSNPSVSDVIKMIRPKADTVNMDAVYAYITEARNWQEKQGNLPEEIQQFELLKKGESTIIPNVPFRALTNIQLSVDQWKAIGRNMPFNTLRQNLNMLQRNGVFADQDFVHEVASKLRNRETVLKVKVFPYQLFTTFLNTQELPTEITLALQDAAEIATENVPAFDGRTVLVVDVSGSMGNPITGQSGVPSMMRCVDVAGLMASCVLRQNKNARVMLVDTQLHSTTLNPRDSIMTNAQIIASKGGGGTDLSIALDQLNKESYKADNVIFVSDNESWAGRRFGVAEAWNTFKRRNGESKLVNIDIQPYIHSQVPDNKDVLNIGGFSDAIWLVIKEFVNRTGTDFVGTIETAVQL